MEELQKSWQRVVGFAPNVILISAGFDAYVRDPITSMTLEVDDFRQLGSWAKGAPCPVAAVLEGGYSTDLPQLIDSFLTAWAE
jgi:acetoin utilization deacetylase AcuC-like enzyme